MAAAWRADLERGPGRSGALVAMVMANHPEAVVLFFALASLPLDLVLLPSDARAWQTTPPVPPGTALVLSPSQADLAAHGQRMNLVPIVLGPAVAHPGAPSWDPRARHVVVLTSGSLGAPKPVCRRFEGLVANAESSIAGYGLRADDGILAAVPLSSSHGLVQAMVVSSLLTSTLTLVPRFDHRAVLAEFATGAIRYFPGVPLMAEMLARTARDGVRAPEISTVTGGSLPPVIAAAFRARLGVDLRSVYGSTESGLIVSPHEGAVGDDVGTALPGVELRIGEDPSTPLPPGAAGPVWFRNSWYMEGYGYPPAIEPRVERDGWFATRDLGVVDASGRLAVLGRLDACFKTAGGYLVNPAHIASVLVGCPGIVEVEVCPCPDGGGTGIGALVVGAGVTVESVRRHAAAHLPPWSWPHVVATAPALPRLPGGKVDREACAAALLPRGARP